MEKGNHFEAPIAGVTTTPGKYYEGEDANYTGADERPTIGGIASGTGEGGEDIPIIDVNDDEIVYGRIVNNDAVTEKDIPWDRKRDLGPIVEGMQRG